LPDETGFLSQSFPEARIALGARLEAVRNDIIRDNLAVAAVGILAGFVLTLPVNGALSALLFGVSAVDPATVCVAALVLLAVSGAASYFPGARATRVDPIHAMRSDN
jgi:putative ABC transport system permease protein